MLDTKTDCRYVAFLVAMLFLLWFVVFVVVVVVVGPSPKGLQLQTKLIFSVFGHLLVKALSRVLQRQGAAPKNVFPLLSAFLSFLSSSPSFSFLLSFLSFLFFLFLSFFLS